MSRHKLIKNMDLDDEMDDYDGGADYNYEEGAEAEELSPEDKEQMAEGTAQVRSILGPEVSITDKDIEASLWHYYYDIEKTVTYLLNQQSSSVAKKSRKATEGAVRTGKGTTIGGYPFETSTCHVQFSAKDFFKDCPWLNIPLMRRGEILIEPLYPCGRLLGGASSLPAPKLSKLAALAAARKRKENDKAGDVDIKGISSSVTLLDKLNINAKAASDVKRTAERSIDTSEKRLKSDDSGRTSKSSTSLKGTGKYPVKMSKAPIQEPTASPKADVVPESTKDSTIETLFIAAAPSAFARTMFGAGSDQHAPALHRPLTFTTHFSPYGLAGDFTESNAFAGPSPDDVVANAQSAFKGMKGNKSKFKDSTGAKTTNGVTDAISKLAVDDAPRAKSKNLDVVAEYQSSKKKNAANFVVIGHVDAGKSTLMGRLLYDLKVVDQRLIDKYRKEAETMGKSSFALAWVLDQGTEERSRGVTIDIAMNKFSTATTDFTILDAPGHRDFIPNMIAGASQADFAVLVIDASTGSFESGLKGQTKEHALLVRSMGVTRIVVAINKLDTVAWSQDRFEEIQQQVSAFLTAAGFLPKNVSFVPCSGLTGANIATLADDENAAWYTGPILLETLESSKPITRALERPLRLTISEIFRGGVQNPLSISGRIDAGSIQVGDKILAVPANMTGYVKALDVDSEPADYAVAGQNATLHLSDIDAAHLKPGDVVCSPRDPIQSVKTFTIKILAFEHVTPMQVDVHRGRLHASGKVERLMAVLDRGSGGVVKKKPRLVKPGEVARIVVGVEGEGIPIEAGCRVVLRAGGETVAAGLVE